MATEEQFETSFLQVCREVAPDSKVVAEWTAQKGQGTLCPMLHSQIDVVKDRLHDESLYESDVVPFMQQLGVGPWYKTLDAAGKANWEASIRKLFQSAKLVANLGKELSIMEHMSKEIMSAPNVQPEDIMRYMMAPDNMNQLSGLFQPERMTEILNNLPFLLGTKNLSEDMTNLQKSGLEIIKDNVD